MQKISLIGCALALVISHNAVGQEIVDDEEPTVLKTLVIGTPLRRDSAIETSTSSVEVIDEEQISRSAAPDLPSLLKSYPGVSITSYGGQGSSTNVHLRGMSATQTLVLINGIRAGSATYGTTSLFNVPLSAISRIEIAKGPHSAQYGADAIGGVINIITKDGSACPEGKTSCSTVTAGVTHPWGAYTDLNTRGQTESGLRYSLGGSAIGTRGYDFSTPLAWGHEPDDDGFRRGSLNFNLSQDVEWGEIYANGIYARGVTQNDNMYPEPNEGQADTFAGKIGTRIDHSDDWNSTVELMHGFDFAKNYRDEVPGYNTFDTRRTGALLRTLKTFELESVTHVVGGGIEAYRESISSNSTDYSVTSRDLAAVYGQYSMAFGGLNVDTGVRLDHNEQFGEATTYNIGASYAVLSDVTLRASYGTGFRAPTFNDLYYPGYSNPDLKAERSRSYEVGLLWNMTDATSLDVAFYQTWLTDGIAASPPTFRPFNIGNAKVTGLEVALTQQFNDRWSGKATVDLRDPKNQDTGKYIPYRDRFKATLETGYKATEKLDLQAKLLYGARRYADAENTTELGDYTTLDLAATYTLDAQSQLKFSVENLLDKQYETISNYRAPGRTISLSFSRTF